VCSVSSSKENIEEGTVMLTRTCEDDMLYEALPPLCVGLGWVLSRWRRDGGLPRQNKELMIPDWPMITVSRKTELVLNFHCDCH
jgi:hypothetical protein